VVAVGPGSAKARVLARGFRTPLGLTWVGRTLYVSAQGSVSRLVVRGKRVVSRKQVVRGLPFGRHQQDTIVLGPDGRLYLGSGSTCDACRERDRRSGAILSFRPDGSDVRVVATGLRNPFGLVFHSSGRLFVSVNARDDLGEDEPAETVVVIEPGADYGWPACWASWALRKLQGSCRGVTAPFAYLEPHSSANSLAFWRGALFVTEWGEYLSERWGRKLVRVDLGTRRATTFADGFVHPLGLAVEPRAGGLLVGDWGRGVIYRLRKR
jgi:glucose/arabinose dehydrogenase